MKKLSIGILGCGAIAKNAYLPSFTGHYADYVTVAACADVMTESAEKLAAAFSIPMVLSPDDLIADPSIDLIVNLTIPEAHYDLNKRALLAGKHVYTGKPLALTKAEAIELGAIAKERGLMLSIAPDTVLGAASQSARRALDNGEIGTVRHVAAWFSMNVAHPRYYRPAAGPFLDMCPYYVGSLVALLGPITRVFAFGALPVLSVKDAPDQTFQPQTPSHGGATLVFASGATGTLGISSDALTYESSIQIIGTQGRLSVSDPNHFGGKICAEDNVRGSREMEFGFDFGERHRGAGVVDIATALQAKRPHRLNADFCVHCTEVLLSIHESTQSGRAVDITTTCERPTPMSVKGSGNPFDLPQV